MLRNGTAAQFQVSDDPEKDTVALTPGSTYTPAGGELTRSGDRSASLKVSRQSVSAEGEALNLCVYNLGGNNFFRLEELSPILGFGWTYEPETDTIRLTAGE